MPPVVNDLLRHEPYLRALARRLVRDDATAEDLVQETWLASLEGPPSPRGALRPWLAGVVRNLARNRARGEARRGRREAASGGDAEPDAEPAEVIGRVEILRLLAHEVLQLREPYRTTVLLRYYEGLSSEQIARRTGSPAGTVRSHLKRGLDQLRQRLDGRFSGDRHAWKAFFLPLLAERAPLASTLAVPPVALAVALSAALFALIWIGTGLRGGAEPEPALVRLDGAAAGPDRMEAGLAGPAERGGPRAPAAGEPDAAPPAPGAAPLRGHVLRTNSTAQPMPAFALRAVHADGTEERIVTDDRGDFVSRTSFPPGRVELHPIDHPDLRSVPTPRKMRGAPTAHDPAVVEHPGDARPDQRHEVSFYGGPTYFLRTRLPAGTSVEDFDVFLEHDDELSERLDPDPVAVRNGMLGGDVRSSQAPLRAPHERVDHLGEPLPWTRFGVETLMLRGQAPWRLRLVSRDGLWYGEAPAPAKNGYEVFVLDVELQPRGRLVCRLDGEGGPPLGVQHDLLAADDTRRGAALDVAQVGPRLEPCEVLEQSFVEPGEYELLLRSWSHETVRHPVSIAAGVTTELELALARLPAGGAVRGRVLSASGRAPDKPIEVYLYEPSRRVMLEARVEPTGAGADGEIGAFALEDVPDGRYELALRSAATLAIRPGTLEVRPPAEDLAFHLDDATARDLVFAALAAEDGEALGAFSVELDLGDGSDIRFLRRTTRGSLRFRNVPPGPHRWRVTAEGRLPAEGRTSPADPSTLRPTLGRGFGARLRARSQAGAPLADVEVLADGRSLGRTDASGELRLEMPGAPPPHGLTARADGWTVVGGTLDPLTGGYSISSTFELDVVLAPASTR